MLTNLRLQNFKGWSDTGNLPLKPITALFGLNGTGKTALLQAILLLKQTAESPNPGILDFGAPDALTDLGDFQTIAHRRNPRNPLKISLDWQTPQPFAVTQWRQTIIETDCLGFDVSLRGDSVAPDQPAVARMTYRVGPAELGMNSIPGGNRYALYFTPPPTAAASPDEPPPSPAFPPPPKCYRFPPQAHAHLAQAGITADFDTALEKRLTGIYYMPPLTAPPPRPNPRAGTKSGRPPIDSILPIWKPASETAPDSTKHHIAHWLKHTGLIHNFRIIPAAPNPGLSEIRVIQHQKGAEIPLADAGSGVARILPLLTLCYDAPPGSAIILNQPETHLHPDVQSALADIIIEAHQTRQIQILLETHSEHLLNRLQRRIAEQKITDSEISLFQCQTQTGGCGIEPLHLDEYGNIKNWPKNFFGDQFGEIAAMSKAMLKRKMGSQ